ncbi:hypothetical protein THAOC_00303 [Thalassiosira oceanica]|uniref:Uncharacterized protein n=1 Tax=Thalassiosira oceanica TaxID=159749 RepID=K0TPD4_THAOC|nr:hypothetical protein THAOC_00303 [Thalassiosira oceanica]|eukprot:EJK77836.1 hypothetical protein THAOC_00303 [Thalassiosira oceanica]
MQSYHHHPVGCLGLQSLCLFGPSPAECAEVRRMMLIGIWPHNQEEVLGFFQCIFWHHYPYFPHIPAIGLQLSSNLCERERYVTSGRYLCQSKMSLLGQTLPTRSKRLQ